MSNQTKPDKATPRPWRIENGTGSIYILDPQGEYLFKTLADSMFQHEKCEKVVKALNEHAALEAVAEAAKVLETGLRTWADSKMKLEARMNLTEALANLATVRNGGGM